MRCKEAREILEREERQELPSGAREHLAACSGCQAYAGDLSKLAEGMRLLAQESVPEPSFGFRTRVVRRLVQEAGRNFLENAGRRVVYATLILVVVLLLAMIVPSSGPVRRAPRLGTYWPQQETMTAGNYQMSVGGLSPAPVLVDMKSSGPNGP